MGARLALLMLAGLASLPAFAAPEADVAAALRVTRYLAELSSLRAEFHQSVADARGRVIERAEGIMAIARPGRFRWDYRTPEQLIVCDGQTVLPDHLPDLAALDLAASDVALHEEPKKQELLGAAPSQIW